MQFRSSEISENFLPVRGVVIPAQVGLQLSTENLQSSTLSDTVGTDETQHLARTGHRQTVELKTVGRVPMRHLCLEIGGQVDNVDGTEGAFFRADTATNTQLLRDKRDFRVWCDLDAELSGTDDGTGLLAFLATFLRSRMC